MSRAALLLAVLLTCSGCTSYLEERAFTKVKSATYEAEIALREVGRVATVEVTEMDPPYGSQLYVHRLDLINIVNHIRHIFLSRFSSTRLQGLRSYVDNRTTNIVRALPTAGRGGNLIDGKFLPWVKDEIGKILDRFKKLETLMVSIDVWSNYPGLHFVFNPLNAPRKRTTGFTNAVGVNLHIGLYHFQITSNRYRFDGSTEGEIDLVDNATNSEVLQCHILPKETEHSEITVTTLCDDCPIDAYLACAPMSRETFGQRLKETAGEN